MLDEGRITQTIANLLMQSVDEAFDQVSHGPLCDWKGLKIHPNFPSYYKFLQSNIFPPKLVTYFTVERLESSCCICAAFLRAHRIARRQLYDFIGAFNNHMSCFPKLLTRMIFFIIFPLFIYTVSDFWLGILIIFYSLLFDS